MAVPRAHQVEVMSLCHNRRYLVIFSLQMSALETILTKSETQCQRSLYGMHSKECVNILCISSFRYQQSICDQGEGDTEYSLSFPGLLNTKPTSSATSYITRGRGCKVKWRQRVQKFSDLSFQQIHQARSIWTKPKPTIKTTPFASSFDTYLHDNNKSYCIIKTLITNLSLDNF